MTLPRGLFPVRSILLTWMSFTTATLTGGYQFEGDSRVIQVRVIDNWQANYRRDDSKVKRTKLGPGL